MASYPPLCPASITTTQCFSRSGVGFLWDKRTSLDPGQVAIINALFNNRKKGQIDCQQEITYKLARSKAGQLGYGRYYGTKGSLETLEKECRGTICKDYYHDIDIVNCHPVLLSQYARRHYQKDLPENDNYVANRDTFLAAMGESRDQAKQELIRILYGGTNRLDCTAKLSAEIRLFSKFLAQQPEHKKLLDAVKHEDNVYGKFLSYILQTEERSCMLAMRESLTADGWSVDVLAYDGVMIRKREGADITVAMRNAEAYIREKTGYEITLVNKDFSYYDVPLLDEEIVKGVTRQMYDEMKADFESNHFYYAPADQYVEVRPNGELMFMKDYHADTYLGAKYIFRKSDKFADYIKFFNLWRDDDSRRIIHSLAFHPSSDPTVFTLPLNFAYKTVEPKEGTEHVALFLELLSILATGKQLEYLLNWLAHLLQKPLENPKVAIVATGIKGCGKDTPFDCVIQTILGAQYSINYTNNKQLFAPHDTGRLNKFLAKVEEADRNECMRNASTLKSMITAAVETFNPKGVKEIQAHNYCRFVFTTNKGNPFEMNDGERRFLVLNAKPTRKNDTAFWNKVWGTLFTPEAGRAIADYFLKRDISKWNVRDIPMSEYQLEVIESEKTSEQKFVEAWDYGELAGEELYDKYRSFCLRENLPFAGNLIALGKRLLPLVRDGAIIKRRKKDGVFYSVPESEVTPPNSEDTGANSGALEAPPLPVEVEASPEISEADRARRDTLMTARRKQLATKGAKKTS